LFLVTAILLLAGCSRQNNGGGTPAGGATVPPVGGPATAAAPTGAPAGGATTSNPTQAGPAATASGNQPAQNPGPLTLTVNSPQDGATVTAPEVVVTGTSSPGAVVTVNDDIIIVGDDGKFQSTVQLEEGPNLIEIVASNDVGDEKSIELGIDYQP
jgi:hypothetical protein